MSKVHDALQTDTVQVNSDKYPAISVIVPACNEEAGIALALKDLLSVLQSTFRTFEVIVVDDGSSDHTARIAQSYPVSLLRHNATRGYGAALKTGIRHAKHDLICITDADDTYPSEHVPELAKHLVSGKYDMVVGARIGEKVAIPVIRRPAKWIIGQLAELVVSEPIPDINSGLRVFLRDPVLRLFGLLPDGFSFTTTITLAMLTNGYLVGYVPINYHVRLGRSKISAIRDTLNFIQLILRIALYFAPLKIFFSLSGFLLFLALAWGLFTRLVLDQLADISTMVIAMTAVQLGAIGLLAELINHRIPSNYRKE